MKFSRKFSVTVLALVAAGWCISLAGCTPDVGQPNDVIRAQARARRRPQKPNYLDEPPGLAPDLPPPPPLRRRDRH